MAVEKAVVDGVFKTECLLPEAAEQKKAAADAPGAVNDESICDQLSLAAKVLEPLASALACGQSPCGGLGKVRWAFFHLERHLNQVAYPPSTILLTPLILRCLHSRKQYMLRPTHNLAYTCNPR